VEMSEHQASNRWSLRVGAHLLRGIGGPAFALLLLFFSHLVGVRFDAGSVSSTWQAGTGTGCTGWVGGGAPRHERPTAHPCCRRVVDPGRR
jgi:hypothetical protein